MGNALKYTGDPDGAWENFRKSLLTAEALAKVNPTDKNVAIDRLIANATLGSALLEEGEVKEASANYQKEFEIANDLASHDPANLQNRRWLMAAYKRIGQAAEAIGDITVALDAYRQDLNLAQTLAAADPLCARKTRGSLMKPRAELPISHLKTLSKRIEKMKMKPKREKARVHFALSRHR